LQQNSFSDDSFCPPMKGVAIMRLILGFHNQAKKLVAEGCPLSLIRKMKELIELTHVRELSADDKAGFESLGARIRERLEKIGASRLAHEQEQEEQEQEEQEKEEGI
jgi:V/A-type H+-transporting ATPase subunit A